MGAKLTMKPVGSSGAEPVADLIVTSSALHGIEIDGELFLRAIDEFPALCVAAAMAEGETVIRSASELRVKESDRIAVMAAALRGMGVAVEVFPDGIKIQGQRKLRGTHCKTYGDHRVAMAMMVAGLVAEGGNTMDDAACIQTSFPCFSETISSLIQKG
jgi:3-phosphoshikimate 1-carboxyvinyltransferase